MGIKPSPRRCCKHYDTARPTPASTFNIQETRYTPRSLKALLTSAGLNFLGFDLDDPSIKQKFAAEFPNDPKAYDLDNRDIFEQNHTGTFTEMYQLWCRRSVGPT